MIASLLSQRGQRGATYPEVVFVVSDTIGLADEGQGHVPVNVELQAIAVDSKAVLGLHRVAEANVTRRYKLQVRGSAYQDVGLQNRGLRMCGSVCLNAEPIRSQSPAASIWYDCL